MITIENKGLMACYYSWRYTGATKQPFEAPFESAQPIADKGLIKVECDKMTEKRRKVADSIPVPASPTPFLESAPR